MKNQLTVAAHVAIYGAFPLLFLILALYDSNPSGRRSVEYTLDKPSAAISPLFPAQRLAGIADGRQRMLAEPVYFTVRYPHRYDAATVAVTVNNPDELHWRVGIEVRGGNPWSYAFVEPQDAGTAQFDLSNAKVSGRSLRFILAVEGLSHNAFLVDRIAVTLTRTPPFEAVLTKLFGV